MTEYIMAIFGHGGVGKSALLIQFLQNHFLDDYDPTIEDYYRKQVTVDDETCLLDILDTAGEEDYSAMRENYLRKGQGFLLVFSISSKRSFDELGALYKLITTAKSTQNIPFVLIGNKCDLENERQVYNNEIEELRELINCPYFETSAKNRINIEESFFALVREIRKDNKPNTNNVTQNRRK